MVERDPRVGDVWRKMTDPVLLLVTERTVVAPPQGFAEWVHYRVNDGRAIRSTTLPKWRKWAKKAEVIHRADDGGTR